MVSAISSEGYRCPMCHEPGYPDEIPAVEIAGLVFKSAACDRYGALPGSNDHAANTMPAHLFRARWLEGEAESPDDLERFAKEFVYVRPPFEPGTAIAEAFGESDARLAWVQHADPVPGEPVRVLIRL